MLIKFDEMEEVVTPHMRGGEGFYACKRHVDANNRIMRGRLEPGCSIGLHTHDTSSEIIYILSGTGKVLYDGAYEPLGPGSCHYCPQGHAHSLINNGQEDLIFFAVVPEHGVASSASFVSP